ncbi:hypothetical protein E2562_037550 [Oryza meyeriana var. granulata]|uniref:NB-ARC domain-containing protein n=1 Tax=Oryza meyeriana var. granulata TaxID=110450 RepID=A0A6G1DT18_9ORYZ|nr:hypothetical protein E2562_037550 [Oryza meyeriana var. granulata]
MDIREAISTGIDVLEATQLEDDLSGLRASMSNARLVIDRGEWGRFKNKDLAVLLSQLKDTTYDAEDLLREFDDQVLWHKMEDADRSWAGQLFSSSLNHAKNLICRSKKRIKEAQDKLKKAVADLERALDLLGLTNIDTVQHMPETSSVIGVQVFGRDEERDAVIEKLGVMIGRDDKRDQVIELLGVPLTRGGKGKRSAQCTGATSASGPKLLKGDISRARSIGNVSVLPIVGIGGVGKTTLAQYIYNDPRVEAHFDVRIWICVSDLFEKKNITKMIIKSISKEYKPLDSLDELQVELTKQLKGRKFLLVLDDIWPIANIEWETFYAPLRHGPEGSMILVTTRFPNVADLVTTRNYYSFVRHEIVDIWVAQGFVAPKGSMSLEDMGIRVECHMQFAICQSRWMAKP